MSPTRVKIPDRYESLVRMPNGGELQSVVAPVQAGLSTIDELYDDMVSAGRGAFLIVRGDPGSGKSTLLHTVHLFREDVVTVGIEADESIPDALDDLDPNEAGLRIVVIKGREVLAHTTEADLQEALLSINSFLRRREGARSIIAWPCNMRQLADTLTARAREIGGEALLGLHGGAFEYAGPAKGQYLSIARRTIEALNAGASLTSLGIADLRAQELAGLAPTLGAFMQALRAEQRRNQSALQNRLAAQDVFQLWTVVIAGNDPESEVGSLTRGAYCNADIDKLLVSTDANIAQELRRYPEKLGLLGATVGARILYVSFMAAMAVVRDFADDDLRTRLSTLGVSMKPDGSASQRLQESQLGGALRGEPQGLRQKGRPPGDDRRQEFDRLTAFAAKDDGALNRTFGVALKSLGLVRAVRAEVPVGGGQNRSSDLMCEIEEGAVHVEFMWRSKVTSGEIACYELEKLKNYGKALGFLNGA